MLPGIGAILAGAGANDNIVFVGGAITTFTGSTGTSNTIALNSGLSGGIASSAQSGDFVLAVYATGSTADRTLAITDGSSDYTLVGSELYADATYDTNLRIAYKFITADTETTFGPSGSTLDAGAAAVYVFRSVDAVTPIDVSPTTATGTNTDTDPPSITPASQNCYIVAVGATASVNEGLSVFTSSDLSDFLTAESSDTNGCVLGIGHVPSWPSGAYDPAAFGGGAGNSWAAMTIALRSA